MREKRGQLVERGEKLLKKKISTQLEIKRVSRKGREIVACVEIIWHATYDEGLFLVFGVLNAKILAFSILDANALIS